MNLAIFASGNGTNARNIIEYFVDHSFIKVKLIVCNVPTAGVIKIAENYNIESIIINRKQFYESQELLDKLKAKGINFIVLAGFLWLLPPYLIHSYARAIINIHPSLLPKYGGKGMFGHFVHDAVFEAQDNETGITIHYVNERYDEGDIILQAKCNIDENDNVEDIQLKVQKLEHEFFPIIIEKLVSNIKQQAEN
ncbi:MAG: phosphoribosylglycinamide formyltransferase [Saprospiraceae bacterium]|nr:phosphoribosylglycinamide formyltransferase [Saprospiraceae bacterium]